MTTKPKRSASIIAWYYVAAGAVLILGGWRAMSWWTEVVGLALLAAGAASLLGDGEWTTWVRGEFDERRKQAADHGFKIAFFVLTWWIGAVAFYASSHHVSTEVWAAGNAVAIAAAVIDYAVVLRKS